MGFRTEIRNAFNTSLSAFAAANTTLVDRVYKARPESLAEVKALYLAGIEEAYQHTEGVRRRTAEVSVVYSVHLTDNEETSDKLETGADALLDWLTTNHHLTGTDTLQEPIRSVPIELTE